MDAQVGLAKFSSSSNVFAQRNVAKYNDNQNNMKSKISRSMRRKTRFESPVRFTVNGSIGREIKQFFRSA